VSVGTSGPTIANVQYLYTNNAVISGDVAVSTLGGNILINGSNFVVNSSVYINNVLATNTFVSSSQIIAVAPANTGNVNLAVFSPSNVGALVNVRYDVVPVWTTAAISIVNGVTSSTSLVVTSDSTLTYTLYSGSLPTGMSLSSSGLISGTPTGYTTLSTATIVVVATNQAGQATQQTITFTIFVGDTYWLYDTFLIAANNGFSANTFVTDFSGNSNQLAIAGVARQSSFNPYQLGYYSYQFDAVSSYCYATADGTLEWTAGGNWTAECWVYLPTAPGSEIDFIARSTYNGVTTDWTLCINTSLQPVFYSNANSLTLTGTLTVPLNRWTHVAASMVAGVVTLYVNGVVASTPTTFSSASSTTASQYIIASADSRHNLCYLSNIRVVKGTALYTGAFTPSTTPLLNVTNTGLLTAQSNRIQDNSLEIGRTFTTNNVQVHLANPFTTTYQYQPGTTSTGNSSLYFSGTTTDYIAVSSATNSALAFPSGATGGFTFEFWVYPVAAAGSSWTCDICGDWTGTMDQVWWELEITSTVINMTLGNNGFGLSSGNIQKTGLTINALQWSHIAMQRRSDGATWDIFLNGVCVGPAITSSNNFNLYTPVSFWLGSGYTATQTTCSPYYISNFRYTQNQVYPSGTNFTVPTSPLSAITGTAILLAQTQSNILQNNGNVNSAITFIQNGSSTKATASAFNPFTSVTNSYTSNQITTFGSGYFNGTTDYLSVPTGALVFGTNNFTVECWVYPTTLQNSSIVDNWINASGSFTTGQWQMYLNSTGTIEFYYATGASASSSVTTTATVPANQWTYITVVRNGSTLTVYLNGVSSASGTLSISTIGAAGVSSIGRQTGGTVVYFPGYISDARVTNGTAVYTQNFVPPINSYNTALSNTTLLTLQNNSPAHNNAFVDQSNFTSNNVITKSGSPTVGTFDPYGDNWSNYFAGATLVGPTTHNVYAAASQDFTVECWFYLTAALATNNMIMGWNTSYFDYIDINPTGYNLNTNNTYTVANSSGPIWSLNTWYHFAVSRNSGTVRVYVNGVLNATVTNTSSLGSGSVAFQIGNWYTSPSYPFPGYISNLRFVQGTGLYTTAFTPSTSPLTYVPNTTLLTCQSPRFIDNSPNNYTLTATNSPQVQKFSPFSTITVPKYYSTSFNGSTDYLTVPSNSNLALGSNWTLEMWVYTPVTLTSSDICLFNTGSSNFFIQMRSGYIGVGQVGIAENYTFTATINPYQWYHIAVSKSGSTIYGFLNGTSMGSGSFTNTYGQSGGIIGALSSGSQSFTGYISNFRLVNGAALYTGNFTPATAPLTSTTVGTTGANVAATLSGNIALLTCQNNQFIDNSGNNVVISAATSTITPLPVSPFTPTPSTITSYSPSQFSGSVYFNGSSYLTVSPGPSGPASGLTILYTAFTFECWFYPITTAPSQSTLFATNWGSGAGFQVWFSPTSMVVQLYSQNSSGTKAIIPNNWYHFALSAVGSTWSSYINGVLFDRTTFTNSGTGTFWIGARGTDGLNFTGYISDLRYTPGTALYQSNFYPGPTPLVPNPVLLTGNATPSGNVTVGNVAQSTFLLNGTSGGVIDSTRTADIYTNGNAMVVSNVSPYSPSTGLYSVYLNGSSYLQVQNFSANVATFTTGNLTIECWANLYTPTSATIYDTRPSGTSAFTGGYSNLWVNSSGIPVFNSAAGSITGTVAITGNTWVNYAVTRSGTSTKLFVNGTQVGSTLTDSTSYISALNRPIIGVDGNSVSSNFATGYISDFRITNGYARYVANFTPVTTAFPAK
jgi:hypothetical protein